MDPSEDEEPATPKEVQEVYDRLRILRECEKRTPEQAVSIQKLQRRYKAITRLEIVGDK